MFFEPEEILLQTVHIFLEEKGGGGFVKEDWGGEVVQKDRGWGKGGINDE